MLETNKNERRNYEKLTYGMVGGGSDSLIGNVHRKAARFEDRAKIEAGTFSRNYEKSKQFGISLGLGEGRLYKDHEQMAKEEANRRDGIDFVVIVTPNKFHYPVAKSFLKRGIHVLCDKPLTLTIDQAKDLKKSKEENDLLLGITYTYSGYPMLKEAKKLIEKGSIGNIRFVYSQYLQDWLSKPIEEENKQASWRTDPEYSGVSNCVSDIGSHIEHTVSYLTGLSISSLNGRLERVVKGRQLDDNARILVNFSNGGTGIYWSSQVAVGHDNSFVIRVYGDKGSVFWNQENPNYLKLNSVDAPQKVISRGKDNVSELSRNFSRLPAGHPEGYYEAFANIYRSFTQAISDKKQGLFNQEDNYDYPTVEEGIKSVRFIHQCVKSSKENQEVSST